MYISRVIIKNYRSIKSLTLSFNSGKNVIVGKNNSGKSNIIKAIDIVLGESSPTYAKYNNITENDFYSNNSETTSKIMIFCELQKNKNEQIDIEEVKRSKFYGKYIDNLFQEEDIIKNKEILYNNSDYYDRKKDEKKERWSNLYFKNSNFKNEFVQKIGNKNKFAFLFTAKINGEIIEKDLKFLVYNEEVNKWTVFFNSQLRNILLQSAIIPAFREPSQQLSLSQWSWYGKMMKALTNNASNEKWEEYENASSKVTEVSNDIFSEVTKEINMGTLKIAFPNTELYFRFLEEKKSELYKNTKIFVDDGFMSDISLKGAGIQSAIIIGLYTYYVKNISKVKNALLCLEEPELYLHPHGRRMISNRVNEFLDAGENQAIIITHAEEFIELKNKNSKIIKITKDNKNGSVAHEINLDQCREVILRNDNKEIFFADKVILCEGKEKLLLEFLNLNYLDGKFDDNNISIISVNGKNNFKKFIQIAQKINVKVYIIADFDYLLRDSTKKLKQYGKKYEGDISNLNLNDLKYITQIKDNEIQKFISNLRNKLLKYSEEKFYKSKSIEEYEDFIFEYENNKFTIRDCINKLQKNNIFIEDAEIENVFKNLTHQKMVEEDIYKLYDSEDVDNEFDQEKLDRLLDFLKSL